MSRFDFLMTCAKGAEQASRKARQYLSLAKGATRDRARVLVGQAHTALMRSADFSATALGEKVTRD